MMSYFGLSLCLGVLLVTTQSACALRCFQCANIELDKSGSSSVMSLLSGKSDPDCGVRETLSNSVTCKMNEVCGSTSAEVSGSLLGSYKVKGQLRGCVPRSSTGCRSIDQSNPLVDLNLKWLSGISNVKGDMCTCDWEMCVLCDGGISINGVCIKYWLLAVVSVGVLIGIILLATCCCCCGCCGCCCCRAERREGIVLRQPTVPYQHLTVITTDTSSTPNLYPTDQSAYNPRGGSMAGGLSVQSGDVVGFSNPMSASGPISDPSYNMRLGGNVVQYNASVPNPFDDPTSGYKQGYGGAAP